MNAQSIKDSIVEWIDKNQKNFADAADKIFDHPELGMQEFFAVGILEELLVKYGFAVEKGVAGIPTAFVAVYGSGNPVVAFNCEYDALPGLSQQKYADKVPVIDGAPGHGCGHNLIGTGNICGAVALKEAMEKFGLSATIKIFGTPAEELCIGKPFMARAGLFKGIDFFMDWHPSFQNYMVCDTNAYFSTYYHFKGRTAHGASPWNGRSALDSALLMAHASEMLREHVPPGKEGSENTWNYTFPDVGPEFPNVVPDRSTSWYIGRFSTSEIMNDFMLRLDKCAEGAAIATGTTVTKELVTAIHERIPNMALNKVIYDNWIKLGTLTFTQKEQQFAKEISKNGGFEPTGITEDIMPNLEYNSGVTDTSEYSWFAPAPLINISMAPAVGGWHNWMITAYAGGRIGRKAMLYAGKLMAVSSIDLILEPDLLAEIRKEYDKRLNGRTYASLLGNLPPAVDVNKQTMEKYRKL